MDITGFGSSSKNPLLFPSILQEIFQRLGVKELKTCRFVCRDWELDAYRAMRGKTKIAVTNYIQVKQYINLLQARKDFCDSFVLNSSICIETPLTSRLFSEYGSNIKSLSLIRSKWKEAQLTTLLFDKLPNLQELSIDFTIPRPDATGIYLFSADSSGKRKVLSNLKHLKIETAAWETQDISPSNTIKAFLNDMFLIAPNLERIATSRPETNYHPLEFLFPLDVAHVATFINGEVVDALDELAGLGFEAQTRRVLFDYLVNLDQRIPRLNKLKEIDIHMILRDEHIRKLITRRYALDKLELVVTQSVVLANLHSLLQNMADTLHTLNLRFLRRSTCNTTFPSVAHLKHVRDLTLTGYRGQFGFIQSFASLERLVIIKVPMISTAFTPQEFNFATPLQNLKTFEIYEEENQSPTNFRRIFVILLAKNFPNLRRLRMDHICDCSLRAIFETMPNLEELIAKNGRFTDAGLTGINLKCRIVPTVSSKVNKGPKSKQQPSIDSLKNLKVLDLHSKEMTDFGISFGVVNCKKLKKLTLLSYHITDASIKKLVDTLELEYLKTEFCYQLTTDIVDYVNQKMGTMEVYINEYEGPMNAMDMWKFLKRNNNMQIPICRMSRTQIENTKKSLRAKDQPSTSATAVAIAGCSSSSRRFQ